MAHVSFETFAKDCKHLIHINELNGLNDWIINWHNRFVIGLFQAVEIDRRDSSLYNKQNILFL